MNASNDIEIIEAIDFLNSKIDFLNSKEEERRAQKKKDRRMRLQRILRDKLSDIPNIEFQNDVGIPVAKINGITFTAEVEEYTNYEMIYATYKSLRSSWFKKEVVTKLKYVKIGESYGDCYSSVLLKDVFKAHLEALKWERENVRKPE
jgi:hypothetical protein